MQKWSPEPLVVDDHSSHFQAMALVENLAIDPSNIAFCPETGFADSRGILTQLTREERGQVMELLELDLRREFEEQREQELAAKQVVEAAQEVAAQAETETLKQWQESLASDIKQEFNDAVNSLARHTVDMAVIMAEKLVRREVQTDREVLVRTLETVLYKAEAGVSLTVTMNPDDASWFANSEELQNRLRVKEIKEDRRLDRGGCLVKTDDLEWDATLQRQLAVLGETMAETLAVPVDPDQTPEGDHA